jgi:hypothetical protein
MTRCFRKVADSLALFVFVAVFLMGVMVVVFMFVVRGLVV